MQKMHQCHDNLETMAVVHNENMTLTITALLKGGADCQKSTDAGFERLSLCDQMRSAAYARKTW